MGDGVSTEMDFKCIGMHVHVCEKAPEGAWGFIEHGKKCSYCQEPLRQLKDSFEAQCWICPNCGDDHSSRAACPELEKLRGELAALRKEIEDAIEVTATPDVGIWFERAKFRDNDDIDTHKALLIRIQEIKK